MAYGLLSHTRRQVDLNVILTGEPNSCPSIETCEQEFFSNAIICDRGTDMETFDGYAAWADTQCVTAFDGLGPDEPANLTQFHLDLFGINARIRSERRRRLENED